MGDDRDGGSRAPLDQGALVRILDRVRTNRQVYRAYLTLRHGEQYIAVFLTTRTWLMDLLEIDDDAWVHGGTPHQSRIVPWAIQSIDHADLDFWQGRVVEEVVTTAIDIFVEYLRG